MPILALPIFFSIHLIMKAIQFIIMFLFLGNLASAQITFTDISETAGIGEMGPNYGVAFGDFDKDGWEDIYVTRRPTANRLYRNLGNNNFEDVAEQAGVDFEGDSKVAIWGDINNDGWLDLFLGNKEEPDMLYLNNQDGTFTDIAGSAGLLGQGKVKAALFGDVDNDGLLDIYVAREFAQNTLYKNIDGTSFEDVILESGALDDQTLAMGAIFFDYDNDNDLDLYLTHDAFYQNLLYQNDGTGKFTDVSVTSGTDYEGFGMGVDFADVNNDGWLDFYITNLYDNTLYINNQDGTFTNIIENSGANDQGMGWGTAFFDLNNDGWKDIYVANNPPFDNICFLNNQDMTYHTVSFGNPLGSHANSYGMACSDINNDGWEDLFIANLNDTIGNQLLLNECHLDNENVNWLKVKTIGVQSNYCGIGARVEVYANGNKWIDEVTAGMGYAAQSSLILHFGIGELASIDKVVVRWPSGILTEIENPAINQLLEVIEDETSALTELPSNIGQIEVFPNPSTDYFNFRIELKKSTKLHLLIYDNQGREIGRVLNNERLKMGKHTLSWDSSNRQSGIYFYRLIQDDLVHSGKLIKH